MLNEPRTYRHPAIQIVLGVLFLGLILFATFVSFDRDALLVLLPFGFFLILIGGYLLYLLTNKTVISEMEISSQNLLGTRSLLWSEIDHVSGRHYGIKLHNRDGDVTVSPSSQLPHYEEVIEFIGEKRPDLFKPQEYPQMTRSWYITLLTVLTIFLIIGVAAWSVMASDQWFMIIFFVLIGVILAWVTLSSPQSIRLEGKSLILKYLFREQTIAADEIEAIQLKSQSSRNGRNYFIVLHLPKNKSVRITSLNPSVPIAYLVLKNWHKKTTDGGPWTTA